jgi:hypothetical protein
MLTPRRRTTRKGTMPIDERLRHSPSIDPEAGPSRLSNESSTRRRLKPRPSAESDVFDGPQLAGSKTVSPAKRKAHETRPVTETTGGRPVLAPPSSPPFEEDDHSENGVTKLKHIMDEVIDKDSVAEGEPDTDDAELEQDLLRHIDRQERRGKTLRTQGDSGAVAGPSGHGLQDSPAHVGAMASQVPDTQASPQHLENASHPPAGARSRLGGDNASSSSSATIRGPATSIAARAPAAPMDGSRIVPGRTAAVSETTLHTTVIQMTAVSEPQTVLGDNHLQEAVQFERVPNAQEQARIRAQTDQEKREELKRIVVGLSQEYDLNYKAMHRLIEECRKRYQHVNQALLRGMIEQALAANLKG